MVLQVPKLKFHSRNLVLWYISYCWKVKMAAFLSVLQKITLPHLAKVENSACTKLKSTFLKVEQNQK